MKIACIRGSRADSSAIDMVEEALRKAGHDLRSISVMPSIAVNSRHDTLLATEMAMRVVSYHDDCELAVVGGDRYEILGAAAGCYLLNIPIAHLSGGDITLGSADDQMRDAISMLATLHFPTHAAAEYRLVRMGVRGSVHCVGAPQIDRLLATNVSRETLFTKNLSVASNWRDKNILVVFHPPTSEQETESGCREMIFALHKILSSSGSLSVFLVSPNADAGNREVSDLFNSFSSSCVCVSQLGSLSASVYLALLANCDCLVGNSSSGIYEAPYFGTPVVNIGTRQRGRPQAACVYNSASQRHQIEACIDAALHHGKYEPVRLFGDGHAAEKIAQIITEWKRP